MKIQMRGWSAVVTILAAPQMLSDLPYIFSGSHLVELIITVSLAIAYDVCFVVYLVTRRNQSVDLFLILALMLWISGLMALAINFLNIPLHASIDTGQFVVIVASLGVVAACLEALVRWARQKRRSGPEPNHFRQW